MKYVVSIARATSLSLNPSQVHFVFESLSEAQVALLRSRR